MMTRSRGEGSAADPGHGGNDRPNAAVDRIAERLERLPAQRRALRKATRRFGETFNGAAWAKAFESPDPDDINRILAVTGGFQGLVNNTIEALKLGADLAGLEPTPRTRGASGLIEAIRADGGFSRQQAETFTELYHTRNGLQHASPDIEADEVHRQVRRLLRHLPRFVESYVAWLKRRGFALP